MWVQGGTGDGEARTRGRQQSEVAGRFEVPCGLKRTARRMPAADPFGRGSTAHRPLARATPSGHYGFAPRDGRGGGPAALMVRGVANQAICAP